MSRSSAAFVVTRAHGYTFRSPFRRSEGSKRSWRTNYLVRLDISGPEGDFLALGESHPRGAETGDSGPSWEFLLVCLEHIQGIRIDVATAASAVSSVRSVVGELKALAAATTPAPALIRSTPRSTARSVARSLARKTGRLDEPQPFRGTLLGVEAALLDAAARTLGLSVTELLGPARASVPTLERHTGSKKVAATKALLAPVPGSGRPIWVDFAASLGRDGSHRLIEDLARSASRGELARSMLLEQPLGLRNRDQLPALQRRARSVSDGADVRVMAGGRCFWGEQSLRRLVRKGGVGALNIRPAAAGGLLASLDLAALAQEIAPEALIVLSDVEGVGEVGRRQLEALAAAMPDVDYLHADEPRGDVVATQGPGFGLGMPHESMIDSITQHEAFPPEPEPTASDMQPNVYEEVTYLQPLGPNGTKGHLLERQALSLGLQTTRFSKGAFVASDGIHDPLLIKWSRSPLSSAVSLALCTHKEATRIRLHRAGVPVPRGRTFVNGDFDSARAYAERLGFPVVVKPAMGVRGIGVVANIGSAEELESAFRQLAESKLGDQDFIVEKHVNGRDYRIVVVGDRVIAAILREPASVVGDGQRSIAELMTYKNLRRRLNPHLWGRPIVYDDAARYQLSREGMTLDSVPEEGRRVMLSNSCSLSQGGDSYDVLDEMHPSIKEASLAAVRAIPGLSFCGVDFLLEDHTLPIDGQEAGICELNAHAAIGNCEYPLYGKPRQVAAAFMDECVSRYGLVTHGERSQRLALKLTIRGRVTAVGYRAWMRRQARTFGVQGWVRNAGKRTVEAVVVGETNPVSALAAAAVLGPRKALPTTVTTVHIEPPQVSDFTIVRTAPQEVHLAS